MVRCGTKRDGKGCPLPRQLSPKAAMADQDQHRARGRIEWSIRRLLECTAVVQNSRGTSPFLETESLNSAGPTDVVRINRVMVMPGDGGSTAGADKEDVSGPYRRTDRSVHVNRSVVAGHFGAASLIGYRFFGRHLRFVC
jgi:hypothetical protein